MKKKGEEEGEKSGAHRIIHAINNILKMPARPKAAQRNSPVRVLALVTEVASFRLVNEPTREHSTLHWKQKSNYVNSKERTSSSIRIG